MKLTLEEVSRVAFLARLELGEAEKERLTHDLNAILEHFNQLQELDTEDVPPTSHTLTLSNIFREDRVIPGLATEEALAAAPDAREGFFIVPRIVET